MPHNQKMSNYQQVLNISAFFKWTDPLKFNELLEIVHSYCDISDMRGIIFRLMW